ncbi:DUF2529 domain-containing protein [Bacillus mesophilum]|uniref:DUF2529 domain-containing protein n=2 Tax=Bacillus mesophilum TaxID=1071718 RepID=A0A7V7RL46_9BACI|nr:DUF2529 family protein [Bacillus mesophilum]KAB2332486.1 DUF2529 domain-containing protein [Bacillus mesophilum]
MLKMFSTQLTGVFNTLQEKESETIEDGARLLAQAAAGAGTIYIYSTHEMKAIAYEATEGAEPLQNAKIWSEEMPLSEIHDTDRFLIAARSGNDEEALKLGRALSDRYIPFVAICANSKSDAGETLEALADVCISLKLTKGLLPDDVGNRFGFPSAIAALFAYHGIKFTLDEIMADY